MDISDIQAIFSHLGGLSTGAFTLLAVLVIAGLVVTYFLRDLHLAIKGENGLNVQVESIKDDVNMLKGDVNTLKGDVNTLKDNVNTLKDNMDMLKGSVHALEGSMNTMLTIVSSTNVANSSSPLRLNDHGIKLAEDIGAKDIVKNNFDDFKSYIGYENIKTPYDLQQSCFSMVHGQYGLHISGRDGFIIPEDTLERMKKSSFDNGVELVVLFTVVGYVLRDRLLEEHPDWDVGQNKQ